MALKIIGNVLEQVENDDSYTHGQTENAWLEYNFCFHCLLNALTLGRNWMNEI